jgi:hypothetical protein
LEPREESEDIKFALDYKASEPIFWSVFEELSNDNNGLFSYDKLQERLVSTGKFFIGEAVLMIEHMEKIGKIEQTEDYHVYRRRRLLPTNKSDSINYYDNCYERVNFCRLRMETTCSTCIESGAARRTSFSESLLLLLHSNSLYNY